jgi:hypothetical protein
MGCAGSWSDTLLHGSVLTCRQQWIWRGGGTWVFTSTSDSQRYHVQVSRLAGLVQAPLQQHLSPAVQSAASHGVQQPLHVWESAKSGTWQLQGSCKCPTCVQYHADGRLIMAVLGMVCLPGGMLA